MYRTGPARETLGNSSIKKKIKEVMPAKNWLLEKGATANRFCS